MQLVAFLVRLKALSSTLPKYLQSYGLREARWIYSISSLVRHSCKPFVLALTRFLKMKNIGLVVIIVMEALFVFPYDAHTESGSCPALMKPEFLNEFNNIMKAQRFVFMSDFKKFCRNFQKGRNE